MGPFVRPGGEAPGRHVPIVCGIVLYDHFMTLHILVILPPTDCRGICLRLSGSFDCPSLGLSVTERLTK
jgi:hypothetical protein